MEERLAELVQALVRINSVNATLANGPGEEAIARFVAAQLEGAGLAPEVQAVGNRQYNVVACVRGRGEAPPLVLNAHLDTVGVEGNPALLTPRREGDRVYGRGSYDMKGSVAVMVLLGEVLARQPLPGDVWLTFSADEEDRSRGTEHLVRHWLPTLDPPPVGVIVLEPTEEQIGVAHKGFVWLEVEVHGRAAHGSRPDEGVDAILPLGRALRELGRLAGELESRPPHPLLGHGSLHASLVEGGSAWSVYPAWARLRWERRTLPGEDEAAVARELDRVVQAMQPGPWWVEGRLVFARSPHEVAPEAAVVRALRQARPEAKLVGMAFWTDAALFGAAGLPAVLFGPCGHGAHADEEWVSVRSLARTLETLLAVVRTTWPAAHANPAAGGERE